MDPQGMLDAAAEATGLALTLEATLRDSARTVALRARIGTGGQDGPGDPARTVVVKGYGPGYEASWARESAALTVLRGRGLPVPELIAAVPDPALIVLADLGAGPSLADAVLGTDARTATDRLSAWADALAAVHRATVGDRHLFAEARAKVETRVNAKATVDLDSTVDTMPHLLRDGADLLAAELPAIGVVPRGAALDELRSAAAALSPDGYALTPADSCPDNNIETADGLVLIDFEQATFRHVAWDAAYLLVPWPSCWCSWGLPSDLAQATLRRWRAAVSPALAVVGTPDFDRDLAIAQSAWALLSTSWFLTRALTEPGGHWPGPTRRAVIRHRLAQARTLGHVRPHLADLADELLVATGRRWPEDRLEPAPAFR